MAPCPPNPALYEAPLNKNPVEYGVAKAGLQQMTRYLAVHWGRAGVRCNCISPGSFLPLAVQKQMPQFIERLSRRSPLGRIGQAPEIAGAVVFLLSDAVFLRHRAQSGGGWRLDRLVMAVSP